jgi:hypothetical protein
MNFSLQIGHNPTSYHSTKNENNPHVKELDNIFREARITAYFYGHKHMASFSISPEGVGYILSGNAHRVDKPRENAYVSKRTLMLNFEETGFVQGVFTERGFRAEYINGKGVCYFKSPFMKPMRRVKHAPPMSFSQFQKEKESRKRRKLEI